MQNINVKIKFYHQIKREIENVALSMVVNRIKYTKKSRDSNKIEQKLYNLSLANIICSIRIDINETMELE